MTLVNCRVCNKEKAESAVVCPHCGDAVRKVSGLLILGVLLFPLLFGWLVFIRKGYSKRAKIWTGIIMALSALYLMSPAGQEAIYAESEPADTAPQYVAQEQSTAPVQNVAVISAEAGTMVDEYEANEVAADTKYTNKRVRITGIVESVGKDLMDDVYVSLGDGNQYEIFHVQAFFDDSYTQKLGRLRPGSKVSVICDVQGVFGSVIAKNCHI
ncbi:OB-fold putative lipoprotein [Photobacterium sp. SDRW27]|uniref:OB-fold protein n=1 Tax=Photobacterium obscurum TaxID=2829490 RepID=UPI0022447D65|nr:hypothetical protein [Photobacterium obscurum]MCW8331862.1 OB-fold putative lipoprotein [Photobacterium obscurum]